MHYLRIKLQILCVLVSITFVSTAPGTSIQTITAQSANARSMIAFVTVDYSTRTMTISLADPARKTIITLLKDGNFFYPMLSPDGKHLAFWGSAPKESTRKIYVMNTDGSNLRPLNLGRPTILAAGQFVWSPDSTQIIFGAIYGNGQPAGFFRVNLDGSDLKEIKFKDIPFYDPHRIAASPDGSRLVILVENETNFTWHLYIANADGSNGHPVTATTPNRQPFDEIAWSPDNQKTLLSVGSISKPGIDPQPLMLGDADGANVKVLLKPPPNHINSISWSPDGSQIAFIAPERGNPKPDGEVWVANANGSGVRALNVPINVGYVGTSWRVIPDDVVLPKAPISFTSAAK
jgi:Tol biopolymer transport system component